MMRQTRFPPLRWSVLPALALALSLAWPTLAAPALAAAAGSGAMVTIDTVAAVRSPGRGQTIRVTGWAADSAAIGTGIQRVDVYLDGEPGVGVYVGSATYGTPRPDVAAVYGRSDWTNCGFTLDWTPQNLTAGEHTLYVAASYAASGSVVKAASLNVRAAQVRPDAPGADGYRDGYPQGEGYGEPYGYGYDPYYSGYGYGYGHGGYSPYYFGGHGYGGYGGYGHGYGGYGHGYGGYGGYGYGHGYGGYGYGHGGFGHGGFGGHGGGHR